ncbi:ZN469 protein, partial [Erythrocercus mccallii]|nr:ZN469 protein [Erythrocercus mccallii]
VKGSPLSPAGKGRARERSRRSGKGERGQQQQQQQQQQLYRLSMAGSRPSPTIGIAYPQQKVTAPKEAEEPPGTGGYRFHVPGVAQRDAQLRPRELGFGRCFPDAAGGRSSSGYTSQAGPSPGPKGQPPSPGIPLKSPGTHGQLHYLEFQANRAECWPSPEKSLAGATYGISVQKAGSFSEGGKGAVHGLGALPCQFPFQLLHDTGKEPFHSQEYLDGGMATSAQLAPGAFAAFHSSPREWPEEPLSGGSYESQGRLYGLPAAPPQPPPFLHPQPAPALQHGPLACCKGRPERPSDPSGALPSSGAIDQTPSTFQENRAVFPSSLHSPAVPKAVGKRQGSGKDGGPGPRLLVQSSPLRRTVPAASSLSQVHFQSKAYCSSPAGAVPFETSVPTTAPTHPRLVQAWEGATKAFSPMDQNSAPYSNPVGNQFSFECQSGPEQRQHRQKNARLPWQQMHLPSAVPAANRLELSRHISSQKLPFPLGTSDWQGSGKAQKGPPISNSPGYHSKKLLAGESLQRGEPSVTGAFSFESGKEPGSPACDSRSKALFYSMAPAAPPPSRSLSGSGLVLPPSALVAASPCESPLPSPVPNPTCGSTCSSLSPMSSSPLNAGFEDSQMTPSPFFQHPCHAKDASKAFHPSEVLSPSSLHYHPPDSVKSFSFPPDALKDDGLLKCAPASPFHRAGAEGPKGCSDGLGGEQPPPPYSSHHLLATSLSSASLDQLDVLLTCRQCDQNYSNLSSFLQHRQFCAAQGEPRDAPRAAEARKALPMEPPKPPGPALSPDPQGHLLALNKSDDFLLDGEGKSEGKEDALKGGLFHGLAASSLPLSASDLDIDDAKLDSLITEALNGLGYQSDNPEIDSSFIDVFADEELPGVKAAGGGMTHKAKEGPAPESKSKQAAEEKAAGEAKAGCFCEDGHPGGEQVKREAGKQHVHRGRVARRAAPREPDPAAEGAERTARLRAGRKNSIPPGSTCSQKHPRKPSQEPPMKGEVGPGVATKSSKPPRFSMKDVKKRKPRSGTWSKELIHKIVQQKNKLHKSKHSFSRKRLGRSERAREKDPAWSYGRKRDQKREAQEDGDVPSQEDAEKEDCAARAQRRSSHSSAGSNHGVPGETGASPPCAAGAAGKGGTQRRRRSGSPAPVPRTPLSPAQDSSPKMRQESKEDIPRGSRRVGSAKPWLAGSRTRPSSEQGVAAGDCAKEEPSPQPQERQTAGTATPGRSPASFSCKEGMEEPRGAAKLPGEAEEPTLRAQSSPELTADHQRHQFAPFPSERLKFHTEEVMAPPHGSNKPSPGRGSATCSGGGMKYTKGQGLCDSGKDYPTAAPTYGGNAVGMMLTAKAPDPYVSSDHAFFDPKGLPGHYEDNLFPKAPALGSPHMDEVYLCRDDIGASSFEQKHSSISPFATEMPQGKASSPLSFDSSSIFGELPVSEFDPYESKDGYVTTFAGNASRKALPFEQPYPPFLPEKDWALMEEVAPMLPEDMTPFHSLSVEKPAAKKFPEEGAVPGSQLSLPLPERMADYNAPFMGNISDDELEIKRLVTELESQLQSSKLGSEVSASLQKPEPNAAVPLRAPGAERFAVLPAEPEAGQEKGLFLGGELGSSSLCAGERLAGEKADMVSAHGEEYERAGEPWPCPLELGSLGSGMCVPAPLATNHFCSKDSSEQLQGSEERDLRKMEKGSSSRSLPGSSTTDQREAPIYADPVTKSPPVVTDPVFPEAMDAAEATQEPLPSLPCQCGAKGFSVPGKADTDPAQLERFAAPLPDPKPQFGFQQGPTPALDLALLPHLKEVSDTEEKPLSRTEPPKTVQNAVDLQGGGDGPVPVEETEERESPSAYQSPGASDRASKPKALLFEMLSVPKESDRPSQEMMVACQETSANPLQQLQLFVARTVKNNEEELLMPCFPGLLAPSLPCATTHIQTEHREQSGGALEREDQTQGEEDSPIGSSTGNVAAAAGKEVLSASGCEQLESLDPGGSYHAKQSTSAKPEPQNNVTELQHLANEGPELRDINIPADGVSQERDDLSPPDSTAVTSLPGQGRKADQLREEQEGDNGTTTLAFRKHERSHPSRAALQEETLGREEGERLGRGRVGKGAQHPGSAPTSPVSPSGPSEGDLHQDHSLGTEIKGSTVSAGVPRERNGELSLDGCHYTESPASLLLPANRVLSDLSVISLEMSQELHRTRVLQREAKAKGPRPELGGPGEAAPGKLDSGWQVRKGEKGTRSQSKDLGEESSNAEKQLNRKVRRRKAKAFPSRSEPGGPCELEKSTGAAGRSSSLPGVMGGLREPDGCTCTEEKTRTSTAQHPQNAKEPSCAGLVEGLGSRMGSPKEMASKETATGAVTSPGELEDPGAVEDTQACKKWIGGFVKQVAKGWGKVSAEDVNAGTGDSPAAGGDTRNRSGALQAPAKGALLLESRDLGTTQDVSVSLQPTPGPSPPPAEAKRRAKADVPPGRERCRDSAATTDLQSFFDDDSMFSQLFPRDEQFARRKCTRVYGKRSKKPRAVPEGSVQPAGAIDLLTIRLASDLSDTSSFCVTREEPCEYETISVDDALMLNMCHGSKAKGGDAAANGSESLEMSLDQEATEQGKEDIDLEDNMLTFLCQNSHADSVPSLNIWGSLEKEGESLSAEDMFEPLMDLEDEHSLQEVSSESPDLAEDSYSAKDNGDSDSPEFHTIDIEMLNAKLKMRDVCFFSPCEDPPGHGEDDAVSLKPKLGKHRSKLEDGKLGKNRGDVTIKTKDKQYKCKVCFQWFLTLGELDFHKLSHNPSPPPTCYMCVQRKFSSREQLRDHLKEKHARNKAGLWACGMCLKEISDVWMYNEHLREHATQFARKGQAQKSVMGLPGCFGEDNAAVTHFLNTIMCRKASRSSRHGDPTNGVSRESRSPREPPLEQEKATKEPLESSVKVKPPAPSSSKASSSPSPEHGAKSESTPKSVPMHPDCKDPSRDCHHCGKQFPKPFKLQRHLVVHSLQKIYLCHKCPMFYQETKELRSHLSQEHGVVEEQEIKHTTLYACELCADVMHVIKKSFICSMCNYTFSKKEQYDRHMEKHLAGSNKTFKFRGVMRPGAACREKGKEGGSLREGMPPSKKRKVAHRGSSPVRLDPTSDLQLVEDGSPSLQAPSDSFPTEPGDLGAPQPSMKAEVLVGDFSELLAEMEKSPFDPLPPPPCLSPSLPPAAAGSPELGLSIEELEKGAFDGKPLPFLDSPEACILENPSADTNAVDGIPFLRLAEKVSELPSPKAESPQATETHKWGNPGASDGSAWEGAAKPSSPGGAQQPLPRKDKTASPAPNRASKDSLPPKKTVGSEAAPGAGSPGSGTEEGQQPISGKEKSMPEAMDSSTKGKEQGSNPGKSSSQQPRGEAAGNATRHGHAEPGRATSKLHPKRRKEHKSLSHRGSSGSRENMEGDGKKKKARPPCPARSESSAELKRGSWSNAEAPALSPGRRDMHCSKLGTKPRTGPQLKKMALDPYNQKKGELRHANGDVKRRKAILGKSLHQVLAKGPAPSPRGSWHGPRGAKAANPASYRSAESQNNLLSQLFGQKLTSFKIPLRRDTSE